ncbi:MAG: hypothetical protein R3F25_10420 [Gammaproteobacteria bacterium]
MAPTFPITFKNCSTCKHWEGDRTFKADGSEVQISSSANKGCCKHAGGEEKAAFMKCESWTS